MENQILQSLTGTFRMFSKDAAFSSHLPDAEQLKVSVKIADEFAHVKDLPAAASTGGADKSSFGPAKQAPQGSNNNENNNTTFNTNAEKLVDAVLAKQQQQQQADLVNKKRNRAEFEASSNNSNNNNSNSKALAFIQEVAAEQKASASASSKQLVHAEDSGLKLMDARRRMESQLQPQWHPPWKLKRVIAGHMGWVRTVAVDPSNEWFATAGTDRTIKIWDLASGVLKLTLTGHASAIRDMAISDRHPYLFSVGEDKMIKCWDLEQNKSVRQYHGHLSGVYCCALHPTLDLLVTGGRDSTVRVWDMRSKTQIFALTGHDNTVSAVTCQAFEPQLISGSMDSTVRCWDLAKGKARTILTNHKKSVRALAVHPSEYTFVSGSHDNIKKWKCPEASFVHNFAGHNAIVNTLAVNADNVLVSAADNGSMHFWDWKTGYNFQSTKTIPQPGSLDSEAGIFCARFDMSGARLITGEADKSIKIWAEDENATPETHPVNFTPDYDAKRY